MRIRSAKSTATSTLRPAACAVLRPAVLGFLALLSHAPLHAQQATIRRANEAFFADPGGVRLGRLAAGTRVAAGPARSGHTAVTLEGWVFSQSLQPANRDGHNLQIRHAPEENLRESPNGRIVARLVQGCLLDEVERRNGWVRVRRSGWIATEAVQPARPAAAAPPLRAGAATPQRSADTAAVPPVVEVDPHRAVVRRRLQFYRGPGESPAGALDAGTPVRITARAGAWVRVEAQGWVRENEIRMADSSILNGVSAAELRGAPEEFRGKLLRWTIQFVALQTADELRPDFLPGQRYILARGPAPEYAFVYILVPREKLAEVQRLQPLASVEIVARVLNGRSAFLANPILELVDIAQ